MPVKKYFLGEPLLLSLLVDDIVPLVEAPRSLFLVHPHDEVSHDSVRLGLHLRLEVLLLTFVLFDRDLEFLDLFFVISLTPI